ncbi:hypothetical protein GCM10009807_28650 [Microbacterium lacus]|uniref:Uncharacterized protein n=1 Tax=Microbacterium lacus TaxID=415217 RepID=A0ABN2H737_9MICO
MRETDGDRRSTRRRQGECRLKGRRRARRFDHDLRSNTRLTCIIRRKHPRCPKLERRRTLAFVEIHADNLDTVDRTGREKRRHPDAPEPDDADAIPRCRRRSVQDGSAARQDRAPEKRRDIGGHVLINAHDGAPVDDCGCRKGGHSEMVLQAASVLVQTALP